MLIGATPERVWDLLADVERWPSWYRACRWVRMEPPVARPGVARPAVGYGQPGHVRRPRPRCL